jgi:hypothetical protein
MTFTISERAQLNREVLREGCKRTDNRFKAMARDGKKWVKLGNHDTIKACNAEAIAYEEGLR